jgi:hypothetical protein
MGSMRACAIIAPLVACGRWDFDPLRDAATGAPCAIDSDCGPCQRCAGQHCVSEPIGPLYAGHRSTCFLGAGGSRWCVGENSGVPGTTALFPTRIAGEDGWTALYLGWGTNLGDRAGELEMWMGQAMPIDMAPDTWAQVTIEIGPWCLRAADGSLTCDSGPIAGTWSTISAGNTHYCGIQAGAIYCWGSDIGDSLGQGVEPDQTVVAAPAQVGTDIDWMDVEIGNALSCGVKKDHTVWCWGYVNATGTDFVDTMGVPTQISPRTDWQWMHVRWNHACGQTTDGAIHCWGFDEYGLEVLPGAVVVAVPTDLGMSFDGFVMGGHHYCGLTGGQWYCWGWNAAGQLAIGTATSHQTPTVPLCTPGT